MTLLIIIIDKEYFDILFKPKLYTHDINMFQYNQFLNRHTHIVKELVPWTKSIFSQPLAAEN